MLANSMVRQLTNLIDGDNCGAASGTTMPVFEPATGTIWASVPESDGTDIDRAVAAAQRAFPAWSGTSAAERSRVLLALADQIDVNLEALAEAESTDTGKPLSLARSVDIPRSAANLRFFATAILHTQGEMHSFDGSGSPAAQGGGRSLHMTLRSPRGVAGLISPWNLPLYLLTWKIAPALATGNTAVCKPSEVTPATASMLGELANKAGMPRGVLNIVHGRGAVAGAAVVTHERVPTVSFTGSTAVGKWIGRECGDRLKRVSLELGGKNAFLVFDDADIERAVELAVRAGFSNQGQICLCGSRLLLHERIADRFLERFVERVRGLRQGDPRDPATQQGALTSAEHLAKVERVVSNARALGGRVLCGGERTPPSELPPRCAGGWFYRPTVVEGLDATCAVEQEEIFGPVVTVQRFSDDAHALALANGTDYGLAAVVCTTHLGRAHRVASQLQAGMVWVNCWLVRDLRTPFGGVKQSGVGREGGNEALRFFTEATNVCIAMEEQ